MKKAIVLTALCALSLNLSAQTTMQFLGVNPDAETAAVAGTGIARPANAFAVESNMAAAALSASKMAFGAGYDIWQPNASKTGIVSVGGFFRVGDNLAIGAGFKNFSEPEYTYASAEGRSTINFKPSEMAVSIGGAYKLSDAFSIGLDAKVALSTLADFAKATSVAADLSLAYSANGISAGLAVSNIGGKVTYSGSDASYSLPMSARAGAAYTVSGFTASLEADYIFSGGLMAGLGAEYWIKDIVAVRAGFHYGDSAKAIPTYASLGLGAKFAGVALNATYLLASETLGGTMMFGLAYAF